MKAKVIHKATYEGWREARCGIVFPAGEGDWPNAPTKFYWKKVTCKKCLATRKQK